MAEHLMAALGLMGASGVGAPSGWALVDAALRRWNEVLAHAPDDPTSPIDLTATTVADVRANARGVFEPTPMLQRVCDRMVLRAAGRVPNEGAVDPVEQRRRM